MAARLSVPQPDALTPSALRLPHLQLLAVQAERGREMYRLLSACRSSSHGCHRGLQGLIDSLTTEERPAAVQPAGLTVQLRPYQLQSLEFMLETERRAGGFRGQFWLQYTNNKQQSYWWSPVFQRVCKVSSAAWGGTLRCCCSPSCPAVLCQLPQSTVESGSCSHLPPPPHACTRLR